MAPERKYALKRIAKGDYLLLANDGNTLWRLVAYEDGPSHGIDSMDRDRDFWAVWEWTRDPSVSTPTPGEIEYLADYWREVSTWHETRAAAINAALGERS